MLNRLFNFIKKTADLGVGTGDLGLLPFQTLPPNVPYLGGTGARQWNIQRSLGPVNSPGFMMLQRRVVPVGLRGSGIGIGGQYILQPLGETTE